MKPLLSTPKSAVNVHRLVGLAAAGLLVFLLSAGPAAGQDDKLPKAEEVLKKHVDALGGKAAFDKLRNRVTKGTFELPAQGMKGTLITYEAPRNKNYTLIDMPGRGPIESGSDGTVHWERTAMTGPRVLEGEEKALAARQSTFNSILYWHKLYKKAETVSVEDVGGQPCYKIEMTPNEGSPEVWYVDQKTYLQPRVDIMYKGLMGVMPVQIMIEDYKKVDGILLPHTIRQSTMGMEQVMKIESIEHNADIPKDRFDLPADIKELLAKKAAEP